MNTFQLSALCLAATLAMGGCDTPKTGTTTSDTRATTTPQTDAASCEHLTGNAKDICVADANGRARIVDAEILAANSPSTQSAHDLRMAKAESEYAIAKERCDDLSGNPKDACLKEADRVYTDAKADSTMKGEVADATSTARETTEGARADPLVAADTAREELDETKRDTAYSIAREKCESLAFEERMNCIQAAEAMAQN